MIGTCLKSQDSSLQVGFMVAKLIGTCLKSQDSSLQVGFMLPSFN